jgi:hypothetical protein
MADYSPTDRLLHRLALSSMGVRRLSLDIERAVIKPTTEPNPAVCVTGLARAGTTALMRALHGSGHFASLTYADMPFVLAPNLWRRVSRGDQRTRRRRQRAHNDGVEVDYDSPEAFEEVFWQLELGDYPSEAGALTAQTVPPAVVASFHAYQQLVCRRYSAERYLAKNNNQILRLASLAPQTPTAMYLIVFRDPLAQAQSLLTQHRRFSNADRFTRQYMQWLGHFEFGATHRPTQLSGGLPSAAGGPSPSPDSVDYWLAQWLDVYGYVETLRGQGLGNVRLVAYERLCNDPQAWPRLCALVGIRATDSPFRRGVSGAEMTTADPRLLDEARALYASLDGYSDASPSAV